MLLTTTTTTAMQPIGRWSRSAASRVQLPGKASWSPCWLQSIYRCGMIVWILFVCQQQGSASGEGVLEPLLGAEDLDA